MRIVRGCGSVPRFRVLPSSVDQFSNKTDRHHRVSPVLFLVLVPLLSFGQTHLDPFDANQLAQPPSSLTAGNPRPTSSPYRISVSQLRLPKKAAVHVRTAESRFERQQYQQAAAEIDRAIDIDPSFAGAFRLKALVQLAEKDFTGAVESAAHAIKLEGADAYSWIALATAFNSLNEWPEAEAAAGQALALDPLAWQGRLELAKSLYGQRKFVLCLNALDQVSQDVPDIYLVRANSLMRLGRTQEAAQQYSLFLEKSPGDSRSEQIRQILSRSPAAQP